jgi:hypothetical protein
LRFLGEARGRNRLASAVRESVDGDVQVLSGSLTRWIVEIATLVESGMPPRLSFGDVVELGAPAPVIGRAVVLELCQRLLGQIVAVDQEQDPMEATHFSSRYDDVTAV